MPLHDHTGRLMYDSCATKHHDTVNEKMHGYLMRQPVLLSKSSCAAPVTKPATPATNPATPTTAAPATQASAPLKSPAGLGASDLAFCEESASKWMGYGLERSVIDGDSQLRMDQQMMTQNGEKTQMNVRTFHAVPNLSRGALLATNESQLVHGGMSTTDTRNCRYECENTVEVDFDRYDPCLMYTPVNVENIVPRWTHGGASSRDITLSDKFQKNMRKLRDRQSTFSAHDPPEIAAPQFARANEPTRGTTDAFYSKPPSSYRRLRNIANQ